MIVIWAVLMVIAAVAWLIFAGDIDAIVGVLFASVCSVVVGAILTVKVPSNSIGLLSLLAGSAWVLYLFGRGYATLALESGEPLPLAYFFGWLGSWTGALFLIGVSLLILCFPTGKPVGWWRVIGLGPLIGATVDHDRRGPSLGAPAGDTGRRPSCSAPTRWYPLVDAGFILGFVSVIPATLSVVARLSEGRVGGAAADQVAARRNQPPCRRLRGRGDVRRLQRSRLVGGIDWPWPRFRSRSCSPFCGTASTTSIGSCLGPCPTSS